MGFRPPPQTAQSGSSNTFIQEIEPTHGSDAWVWYPVDADGVWDETTRVYAPGTPTAPSFTVSPVISGTPLVGSTLTCDGGTATGSPTPTKTYQWKRAGTNLSGATASTYVLVSGDVANAITCTVTATNGVGSPATATSNTITPAISANSVAPAITGTAETGQTLTCSTGTWSGSPTFTRQWKRNGTNISGATASTYVLQGADEGTAVKCSVTATNANGSASANSNTVNPTAPAEVTSYDDEVLADSPVGYWPLDETSGTTAADLSGNNRHGTYVGGITLGGPSLLPAVAHSVDIASTSTYVEIPDSNALDLTLPCALEFWGQLDVNGAYPQWRAIVHGIPGENGVSFGVGNLGLQATIYGVANYSDAASNLVKDTPYHCVVVFKTNGDVEFYLNGALAYTATGGTSIAAATTNLIIGTDGATFWDGKIAAVAVYNTALSGARIAAHYAARTA